MSKKVRTVKLSSCLRELSNSRHPVPFLLLNVDLPSPDFAGSISLSVFLQYPLYLNHPRFLRSVRRARGSTTGRRIPILREQLGPLRQILIRWVSKIRKLVPHVPRILSKSTKPRLSGYPRRENRRRVGIQTEIFHRFMTEG